MRELELDCREAAAMIRKESGEVPAWLVLDDDE